MNDDTEIRFLEKACAFCKWYVHRPGLMQGYCTLRAKDQSCPVMPYETCDKHETKVYK